MSPARGYLAATELPAGAVLRLRPRTNKGAVLRAAYVLGVAAHTVADPNDRKALTDRAALLRSRVVATEAWVSVPWGVNPVPDPDGSGAINDWLGGAAQFARTHGAPDGARLANQIMQAAPAPEPKAAGLPGSWDKLASFVGETITATREDLLQTGTKLGQTAIIAYAAMAVVVAVVLILVLAVYFGAPSAKSYALAFQS